MISEWSAYIIKSSDLFVPDGDKVVVEDDEGQEVQEEV
jgi:hypothetical protein